MQHGVLQQRLVVVPVVWHQLEQAELVVRVVVLLVIGILVLQEGQQHLVVACRTRGTRALWPLRATRRINEHTVTTEFEHSDHRVRARAD